MNEMLDGPLSPKVFLKRLAWTAASNVALGGLYPWQLEQHWLRIERLRMPLRHLGRPTQPIRLVHISDLHCGPLVLDSQLRQYIDLVNRMDADFVAVTGDLVSGQRDTARRAAALLRELSPKVATVACLGNHDYGLLHPRGLGMARGLAEYLTEQLTRADVFVMLNESRRFSLAGTTVQFVGLEDCWSRTYDPQAAFEDARADLPTVALCHNPDAAEELVSLGAQWVLAGHTHGKGVADGRLNDTLFPAACREFVAGRYDLPDGATLYVNRGLSHSRRVSREHWPEITVFELEPAAEPTGTATAR